MPAPAPATTATSATSATTADLERLLPGCGPYVVLVLPEPGASAALLLTRVDGRAALPAAVARARREEPDALLLAVVPAAEPPGTVVAALGAGADDVVRGRDAQEVRARVSAVHRGRELARAPRADRTTEPPAGAS